MSVWGWVILVIVLAVASTFEVVLITTTVGKVMESKMKTAVELQMKVNDRLMEQLDKLMKGTVELMVNSINGMDNKKINNVKAFPPKDWE